MMTRLVFGGSAGLVAPPFRQSILYGWAAALRDTRGQIGAALALALIAMAVLGPWLAPYPPNTPDYIRVLEAPSAAHWLGTDSTGRDQLSRLLDGARRSLGGALLVTFIATGLGLLVGLLAAFGGRAVDMILMRVVDMFMAIPGLIFAFMVLGILGPGYQNLLLALALADWAYFARISRIAARRAALSPAYAAARLYGVPAPIAILRHVLPAAAAPLVLLGTLGLGGTITAISAFSFLGLGVAVPHAEWGAMLAESRYFFTIAPWLLLAPAACILLAVLSANLLGEALRDAALPEGRS